ncbi:MAG: hypothetical protein LUD07_06895 [Clostridiales bacterium]|nr:hypothetical protein [Clostridiales bacterium]
MRENCLSYSEIVNYFGDEKITDRYRFLYDKITEYIAVRGLQDKLMIHEGLLQQTVMDYFVDIYRLKEFHKIDKADMTKILAYEAYWLLRRKPILPLAKSGESRLIFANEGFVTTLVAHEFLLPSADEPLSQNEEEYMLEFLRHLNYHFKYRNIEKQNLELVLLSFKTGRSV